MGERTRDEPDDLVRLWVGVTEKGEAPFIKQFNDADKAVQASVVQTLRHDLSRVNSGLGVAAGKKLAGHDLWQSGQPRHKGAATRYLYRRFGTKLVLFDVFTKTRNSDNEAAIRRANPVHEMVAPNGADSDNVERLIIELTGDARKPFRARRAMALDDVGVLEPARDIPLELTRPLPEAGAANPLVRVAELEAQLLRWNQSQNARDQRDAELSRLLAEQELDAEQPARPDARDEAFDETVLAEWDRPVFDLGKLRQWKLFDFELEYHDEVVAPEEAERTVALRAKFAEERVDMIKECERLARVGRESVETARSHWMKLGDVLMDNGQTTREFLDMWIRLHQDALDVQKIVLAKEFSPPRNAELQRARIVSRKAQTIDAIGGQVMKRQRPAIVLTTGTPVMQWMSKGRKVDPGAATRRTIAALVARESYDQFLHLHGRAFEGISRERLAEPSFVDDVLTPICKAQKRLGLEPGTGLASEVQPLTQTLALSL